MQLQFRLMFFGKRHISLKNAPKIKMKIANILPIFELY